uniref:Murein DD-endopeptidase MepM and murein hydrolase activator NlpD, contain LysM domain n=1 Tax=Candidatus Kentrum sp. FW TaxID=2126338 RepID=A0A450SNL0_9GAMM|nr:MAG: Murein DD-endopeptidase MepM and murein hydrolase activator NlpD, contain LysM domain [Candidatus Kentron sp. FW]
MPKPNSSLINLSETAFSHDRNRYSCPLLTGSKVGSPPSGKKIGFRKGLYFLALIIFFCQTPSQATLARDVELAGPLAQGALIQGHTDPEAQVVFKDRKVRISPEGLFLIGFGRNEAPTVDLVVTFPDGYRIRKTLSIKQRKYKTQRIDGLPKKKVSPTKLDLNGIREETAKVKAARTRDDARTDFLEGFIWPVKGRITGVYGSRRILNGKERRPHFGIDIAVPTGTPVRAPASGIVTLAHPDMFFSGGTLILDHGHGLSSSFLHLERILVEEGKHVRQGDIIAEVGATGRATGPHLDWRMNLFKTRIDPQLLVNSDPTPDPTP